MDDYNYNQFSTHDLALAAALVCCGFVIERLDIAHTGRANFIFTEDELISPAIKDFWSGTLNVEPKTYFDTIKRLKTRIYSGV